MTGPLHGRPGSERSQHAEELANPSWKIVEDWLFYSCAPAASELEVRDVPHKSLGISPMAQPLCHFTLQVLRRQTFHMRACTSTAAWARFCVRFCFFFGTGRRRLAVEGKKNSGNNVLVNLDWAIARSTRKRKESARRRACQPILEALGRLTIFASVPQQHLN